MNSGEFNQGKQFIPTKSFQEYVDDWKNDKKVDNPFLQQAKIDELQTRIKELEEEKTTELIIEKYDYFGLITNINKTKCCGILPITNENYCPNCGRKIIRK